MDSYDVVIIGGGAAGLSAGLVLARARRRVLVVDAGEPRNAPAAHMHGFLSRDGMPPAELLAVGRDEVAGYGGTLVTDSVTDVVQQRSARGAGNVSFAVLLASGRRVQARRVLVTTGLKDQLPEVEGLRERWARDVLHCPYCHGHEVRDQALGVLWNGPESVRYAQIVRQWTGDVVLFAPVETLTPVERSQLVARAIGVVEGDVARVVVHDDRLVGLQLADGRTVPRAALFVPPTFVPNHRVLTSLGCETDPRGWVVADRTGATSVPGVWVAGNVADPRAQVITAAGQGSAAAIAVNGDLVDEDVRDAVHDFDNGFTR